MRRGSTALRLCLLASILGSVFIVPAGTGGQGSAPSGRIAFGRAGDIWVWQNGESKRLLEDGNLSDPVWSPSGNELLYVRSGDSYSNLVLRYLDSGDEVQLTYNQPEGQVGTLDYANNSVWAVSPDWSTSGVIAFASDFYTPNSLMTLWLIYDLSAGPEAALSVQGEGNIEDVTLSTDGSIAGYTVRETDELGFNHTYVALRDLTDGVAYELADEPGGVFDPAITPNNQEVAVAIRSGETTDIWIVDRATGDQQRVTTDADATAPCWSPDGKWLAYVRMVDYEFEIWAAPVTAGGFGEPQRLARYRDIDAPAGLSWTMS